MSVTSPSEFIKDQMDKPVEDSKKWKMAIYGLKGVAFFFLVGGAVFVINPSLADKMVSLVNIAITAWGGIVAVYLGAQGSVEYKATSALQTLNAPGMGPPGKPLPVIVKNDPKNAVNTKEATTDKESAKKDAKADDQFEK